MENVKQEKFQVNDPEYEASLARVNEASAKFKQSLRLLSKNDLIKMNVGLFAEVVRLNSMLQRTVEVKDEKNVDSNVCTDDSGSERTSGSESVGSK